MLPLRQQCIRAADTEPLRPDVRRDSLVTTGSADGKQKTIADCRCEIPRPAFHSRSRIRQVRKAQRARPVVHVILASGWDIAYASCGAYIASAPLLRVRHRTARLHANHEFLRRDHHWRRPQRTGRGRLLGPRKETGVRARASGRAGRRGHDRSALAGISRFDRGLCRQPVDA